MFSIYLILAGTACFLVAAALFFYQLIVFQKSPESIKKNLLGSTYSLTKIKILKGFSITLSTNWVSLLFLVPCMILYSWGFATRTNEPVTERYVTIHLGFDEANEEDEPESVAGWRPDFSAGEVAVIVNGETNTMHSTPRISATGIVTMKFLLHGDNSFHEQIQAIDYTVESYQLSSDCTSLKFASGSLIPFAHDPIEEEGDKLRYSLKLTRGIKPNDTCPLVASEV